MTNRIRETYNKYPAPFWTLMGVTLIDQMGRWLLFPFFALYATQKFGINMTQMGLILGTFFVAGMIGKLIAGAVSDKFGRRSLIIFGLLVSAGTSLAMGLAANSNVFIIMVAVAGLMSAVGEPAQHAIIADLLPETQRPDGYSISRIVANLATAVGPLLGGLLAAHSYLALFIFDAISSLIAAGFARANLPETMPEPSPEEDEKTLLDTLKGYRLVAQDTRFVLFLLCSVFMVMPYTQTFATLSVFMRDVHSYSPNFYSYLLTINAVMVIVLQYTLTNKLKRFPELLVMAGGAGLIGLGLVLYAVGGQFIYFVLGIVVLTLGEIAVVPVAQALVANFSPPNMRSRYAAANGLVWSVANTAGPILAGLLIDNISPYAVWIASGFVTLFAVLGYLKLHVDQNPSMPQRRIITSAD